MDRSHHGVLRITGEDRLSWLHSLTTQDTEHLAPGLATQALVLSPNGHVEHHLTLTDDGSAVWIHVEPGTAGPLLAFLESMRFMLRVDPADVTAEFALITLMGPDTAGEPPDGTAVALADSFGMDVIVPRDRLAAIAADLQQRGARLAEVAAYEALRIAAHRPRLGLDTDRRTIPHEVGWIETAVHLSKGCTGARRPWPGCTTWAIPRACWCSCTSTAARTPCPPTATRSRWATRRSGSPGRPRATSSWARSPWR